MFANGAATAAFASLVASGANAAANKHRQVEAPSQDYKTADIASPDLDPKIEVVAMDESVVIPKPPPGGKVYATPTMQEITVSAQRPGFNSFIGTSGGVLMTATAGEGLAAGYRNQSRVHTRNLVKVGKVGASLYGGTRLVKGAHTLYSSVPNSDKVALWNGINELINPSGLSIGEASGGGPVLDPIRYRPEQHGN